MKKLIACLLTLMLVAFVAMPVFAIPDSAEDAASFGIADGYVRTKEVYKSHDGVSTTTARSYNKQGKLLKEVEKHTEPNYSDTTAKAYAYDKKGNLIKETYSYKSSESSAYRQITTYAYDKKGNRILEDVSAGESSHTLKSTYDKNGNLIKEIDYLNNGISTTIYTYNSKGKPVKQVCKTVYEDQTQDAKVTAYTYDKAGNQIKLVYSETSFDGSKEKQVVTDVFNSKKQHVKRTEVFSFQSGDGSFKSTTKQSFSYTYNKNGELTKEAMVSVYNNDPPQTVTTAHVYDNQGREIKTAIVGKREDGTDKTTTTFTYDKNGNLTKETMTYRNSEGTSKTVDAYAYDKAGNLLKRVHSFRIPGNISGKNVWAYAYQKIGG